MKILDMMLHEGFATIWCDDMYHGFNDSALKSDILVLN